MLPGEPSVHVAYGDDGKEEVPKDVGCQLCAAALPRASSRNLCLLWLHVSCRNGSNTMLQEEGGERGKVLRLSKHDNVPDPHGAGAFGLPSHRVAPRVR